MRRNNGSNGSNNLSEFDNTPYYIISDKLKSNNFYHYRIIPSHCVWSYK